LTSWSEGHRQRDYRRSPRPRLRGRRQTTSRGQPETRQVHSTISSLTLTVRRGGGAPACVHALNAQAQVHAAARMSLLRRRRAVMTDPRRTDLTRLRIGTSTDASGADHAGGRH
jgi:hypothetical protein